ncbi:hypothetical protein CTheo_8800 [Ceratobasidium theobromae]|uniref:Uncharacterized protein n=1 Tax=Ceratobasidium theobromae TaxID=1582974 RepID=A0A5N5Q8L5_9AGAM|nr:hypothetical protein CTheo_8800 [Ceratobasidium theobromae]
MKAPPNPSYSEKAWNAPYYGGAVNLLGKAIQDMNIRRGKKDHANFVLIFQSSGTGKSRVVDELAKYIFTIPLNLRPSKDIGFPTGDEGLLGLLNLGIRQNSLSAPQVYILYNIFFMNLFDRVQQVLSGLPEQSSQDELAQKFRNHLIEHRQELYDGVIKKTEENMKAFYDTNPDPLAPTIAQQQAKYHDAAHVQVINSFQTLDLFVLFLSTNSKITSYSPSHVFWSLKEGQTPFNELPFDQWKEPHLLKANAHTLKEVCAPGFMVRFGQPLFWMTYESGDDLIKHNIINFTQVKLAGTKQIEKISDDECDDAQLTEQKLVASHMQVTFTVPEHCNYIYSGYPSEPILAEAAAQLMYLNSMHNGIPDVLLNWCKNDLIPKGECGELVAQLLLTKAHDHAVACLFLKDTPTYTTLILLVDFLIALVGESHTEKLFNMVPDNVLDLTMLKESRLGSLKLNFTHWVKAGDSCAVTDEAGVAGLGCSMAWQCYDQQEAIDLVIPLLLEDEDKDTKLGQDNVSAIFLQIKNRNRLQKVDVDAENLGFFTCHLDKEEKPRPYLTIVLNLGVHKQNTSSPVQIPTPVMRKSPRTAQSQHPQYLFTVFSCSHDAFPNIISKHEESKYDVILASGTLLNEHTRQGDIFLKALIDLKPFWIKNQDGHGLFVMTQNGMTYFICIFL